MPDEERMGQRLGARARGLRKRLDRPRRVVLRDFLVFEIKLLLDGAKGIAISFLALASLVLDLAHPGDSPGHRFYGVMRLGERLDRWLSLYGAAEAAEDDPEGLFGVSRAGSPTLLGRLEALVHHAVVGADDGETFAEVHPDPDPHEPVDDQLTDPTSPPRPAGWFDRGLSALDRAVDSLDRNPAAPSAAGNADTPPQEPADEPVPKSGDGEPGTAARLGTPRAEGPARPSRDE